MLNYYDTLKEELQKALSRTAMGYLKYGLELFHKERKSSFTGIEPVIGNLAVAVELMLKTFAVKNNPLLLFKELPQELRIAFASPESVISKNFNWRPYDIDLRSFKYKTFGLEEMASTFYVFFPSHKQALKTHFRLLVDCRNMSLHSALPAFQEYDMGRTVYLALSVYKILDEAKAFQHTCVLADGTEHLYSASNRVYLRNEDKQFLASFEEEIVDRVRKKVEQAKDKSKTLTCKSSFIYVDDWDVFVTSCPICGCAGVLTGETQIEAQEDEDGILYPYLLFLADMFECKECGLILDDPWELELAGMDIHYDRPQTDMDKWESEEADVDEYYYDERF